MAINPPSFRFPYALLAKLPPEARDAHTATFDALTDIYQSLRLQKQNSSTSNTTVNETVLGTSGNGTDTTAGVSSFNGSTGEVSYFPDMFLVNNQTGQTSYTTQTGDAGAIIILDDAASIAVGLNYSVATNWATVIANYGTGAATATPVSVPSGATSTITYPGNIGASSMPIPSGYAASLYFDGNNFWAVLIPITGVVGVTQIIAGTNITISPIGGTGIVTINATAGSISRIPHDVTGSRSFGSIFQNTTGQEMWVTGWGGTTGGATSDLTALIDTVNPPLTALWGNEYTGSVSGGKAGFGFVVPNNYYYELVLTGTGAITSLGKWIEYF